MFHHVKSLHFRDIPWDAHFEAYCITGQVPFGSLVDHALGWWKHKGKNVYFYSVELDPHSIASGHMQLGNEVLSFQYSYILAIKRG
jgi:hypothetical protein